MLFEHSISLMIFRDEFEIDQTQKAISQNVLQ